MWKGQANETRRSARGGRFLFNKKVIPIKIIEMLRFLLEKVTCFFEKRVLVTINYNRNKMLNRTSEIGIHISIQNLLLTERANDISRHEVAVSTLGT